MYFIKNTGSRGGNCKYMQMATFPQETTGRCLNRGSDGAHDARLIMQVLINLLDNAVKAAPPEVGNKITVKDLAGENAGLCG